MTQRSLFRPACAGLMLASTFVAHAAPSADLGTVVVSAPADSGYTVPDSHAGTKTDTTFLDTPMAVQVIPRQVLDDQQVISIKDAVKNVSGVMSADYNWYDFVQIRGFTNGYAANFRDGLQLQAITGLEMALVDRIEVVKGPSSMLYGRIDPGGFVNLVTKRPQANAAYRIDQQFGSFGLYRTTVDLTGKLREDGSLRYRAVGAFSQSESHLDEVEHDNKAGLLAITWLPNERFEFNFNLERQDHRFMDTEDQGIPIVGRRPVKVPRHSWYGDTVNRELPNEQDRTLVGYDWTLALGERWKLTQRFHFDMRDEQQLTIFGVGFDGVKTLDRGLWFVHPERETFATNLDLQGEFELAGMQHEMLFGFDWFRFTSDWRGFSGTTPAIPSINIFAPRYGVDAQALQTLAPNFFYDTRDEWKGLYLQDQIALTSRWSLLAGGRYDWAEYGNGYSETSYAQAQAGLRPQSDRSFSPRVGLLYKLLPSVSVYGSFSESFGANNGRAADGGNFNPQGGRQFELGTKASAFDGRLTTSATFFHLEKTNVLTPDLSTADPNDQIALGEVRNQGLELDVAGQLTRHLSLIASYTYSDATITRDQSGNQGKRQPNVPDHAASLWTRFDSAPGERCGWELGGGLYLLDERGGDPADSWTLPGYARVDAMAAWRMPIGATRLRLQLNAQNLLDKSYYDRGSSSAKYGTPRTLIGAVSLEF